MQKKIVNHSEGYSYEIDVVTGITKPLGRKPKMGAGNKPDNKPGPKPKQKKATGAKPSKKPGPKPGKKQTK